MKLLARVGWGPVVILVLIAIASLAGPALCMFDFSAYYRGALNLIQGLNPYEIPHPTQYLTDCSSTYMPAPDSPRLAIYPPPLALPLYAVFAWLDFTLAKRVFLVMLIAVPLLASYASLRVISAPGVRRSELLLLAAAAIPFGIIIQAALWGSPSWIALLGILLFLQAAQRGLFLPAGAALLLCLVKPHLLVLPAAAVFSWSICRRRFQFILGFAAACLAALIAAMLLRPEVIQDYLSSLSYSAHGSLTPLQYGGATLPGLLRQSSGEYWSIIVLGVAVILALFSGAKETDPARLVIRWLPFSVLFALYGWAHDYLVLLPVFFFIAKRSAELARAGHSQRAAVAAVGLFVANVLALYAGIHIYTFNLYFLAANLIWCALIVLTAPDARSVR